MSRAIYALPLAAQESVPSGLEAVALGRNERTLYLLGACDPHPGLEAAGATRLGARLSELSDTDAAECMVVLVLRAIPGTASTPAGAVQLMVRWCDLVDGEEIVGEPQLSVVFAGDDPDDYR